MKVKELIYVDLIDLILVLLLVAIAVLATYSAIDYLVKKDQSMGEPCVFGPTIEEQVDCYHRAKSIGGCVVVDYDKCTVLTEEQCVDI